jgi:hypothetical protein
MKDIKGYEGLYAVTSCGKVWSYRKNKFLKPLTHNNGYLRVNIYSANRKCKTCMLHRLVAETYLANPTNLPQVNHKDENKLNNCLNNLEFCTAAYNNSYGTHVSRTAEAHSSPVYCVELNTCYKSIADAASALQISKGNLCSVIKGNRTTAGGYHWRLAN